MELRVAYQNTNPVGGTFVTPVWFGLHDESFDLFETGSPASLGLERIAEDGTFEEIAAEFDAADEGGQAGVLFGPGTPPVLAPGEVASTVVTVDDPNEQFLISAASMILPSNDAFVGTGAPTQIFDEDGNFLGEVNRTFDGDNIYDAGTEVNSELDAAFLNQLGPDTGIDQGNAAIQIHPGFIGSVNNPASEFAQQILGGTTAVGAVIDPVLGDFTVDRDAVVGVLHVNEANTTEGSDGFDFVVGDERDDIVDGNGFADIILGRGGWDVLNGGAGADLIFGGSGLDEIDGGSGSDFIRGGAGNDIITGGDGDDVVQGNRGDDVLSGGAGDDFVRGFAGSDLFVIALESDIDQIRDFTAGEDRVDLRAFATSFDELDIVDGTLSNGAPGAILTLDDGTVVEFLRVSAESLQAEDFLF